MKEVGSTPLIRENIPLAPFTTLNIGGPARYMSEIESEEQLIEALDFADRREIPTFILGGGSNILISDRGFPGLVLRVRILGIRHTDKGGGRIVAAAGEEWDQFVEHCVDQDLAGIECLSGIPGTVGGTPIQNVGAYGQEVGNVVESVRVLDKETHAISQLSGFDCKFAYRSSIFRTSHRNRFVILQIAFVLRPKGPPCINYPDLQRHFASRRRTPGLNEVRAAVLGIRQTKGMVFQADDPNSRSAGSFFKNPILSPDRIEEMQYEMRARGLLASSDLIPRFPAPGGYMKVPAAWLVERAGFKRGFTMGEAGLSTKHNLALVNLGGATAQNILDLAHEIQTRVQLLCDIELEPEPVFVGFYANGQESTSGWGHD